MKAVKKISALKARKNLGQLLEEVYNQGVQYVIERAGRPMAAVVPLRQLQEWKDQKAPATKITRDTAAEQAVKTQAARGKA